MPADRRRREQGYRNAVFGARTIIRMLIYVLIAVILIFLGKTAYTYGYSIFNETGMEASPGTDVEVTIPDGASVRDIAAILRANGLIAETGVFVLQERLSEYHGELKAGTYTLNTSQTPTEMMAVISGDVTAGAGSSDSSVSDDGAAAASSESGNGT